MHDLFVVTGRSDAVGCSIAQPDFRYRCGAKQPLAAHSRSPCSGPKPDRSVAPIVRPSCRRNKAANAAAKAQLGIAGHENRNGNDGTITRFGWKAQNKSLELFGGEAYNVEQGVTNQIFPTERDETPGCGFNTTPEDTTNFSTASVLQSISDVTGFAAFMRFLAPPQPAPDNPSIANGRQLFSQIGCTACHTAVLNTGNAASPALRNQQVHLYSDLLVHVMGTGLADGVTQGTAEGNEWRTAPLWGLGQRLFFLHDGRTSDLAAGHCPPRKPGIGKRNTAVARLQRTDYRGPSRIC